MEFKTMPTLSESKKAQITDALVKCGVSPDEGAIAAIIDIMKNDGRISIPTAAKRYAETVGQNHATNAPGAQSQPRQAVASLQNQVLDKAARKLADQWKATLENRAMAYLLGDIESGEIGLDFEDQLVESFAAFGEAIEVECQAIAGGSPSPLLLESATSAGDIE
jgi:hypothetical protein